MLYKKLVVPGVVMLAFWIVGAVMWQSSGYLLSLFFFGYIGTALGGGLGLYTALPRHKKPLGRRLTLFLVGTFLFVFAAVLGRENMQLEGFFFGLLGGVIQAAVIHYFIAKILGPLLFGRLWCGWACWTVMVLDLLPYKRSPGRLPGRWGWLRYAHFAFSLGVVLLLWFGVGFEDGAVGLTALYWFLAGNVLYYLVGITLAVVLKDNRAFCKYVCPITLPLKLTSRLALLKVAGDPARCDGCGACARTCPMDIQVYAYVQEGQRVRSTECTLCQTCVTACPQETLKLSFGLDLGGEEHLRERAPVTPPLTGWTVSPEQEHV
jgi:polyferredoxin